MPDCLCVYVCVPDCLCMCVYMCVGVVGDVEAMDSEDEASDAEMTSVMVTVGTESVPFTEVTEQMVARMSAAEKADYVRLGQQLYDQFNHWLTLQCETADLWLTLQCEWLDVTMWNSSSMTSSIMTDVTMWMTLCYNVKQQLYDQFNHWLTLQCETTTCLVFDCTQPTRSAEDLQYVTASQSLQTFRKRLKTELFQRSYTTASLPWLSIM